MVLFSQKNYIEGAFCDVKLQDTPLLNPYNGQVLGYMASSKKEDMEKAILAAQKVHEEGSWYGLSARRAEYLLAIGEGLKPYLEEIAHLESKNTGVVISQTMGLAKLLPMIFEGAASQVVDHPDKEDLTKKPGVPIELWRKPWGPVLCLTPWNAPSPIACHKLASAIASGAPVIVKPSEYTPYSIQKVFEVIDKVGLPKGVVSLIHGGAFEGGLLAGDKRVKAVSFTGGFEGGREVAVSCAKQLKPAQLELGGHNPFIILKGADKDKVLDGLIAGLTTLNGQWCRGVGQVFCPQEEKAGLIEAFVARAARLKIGDPLDAKSEMGPLIHRQHKQRLMQRVLEYGDLGARLTSPHGFEEHPCFMPPGLIDGLSLKKDIWELFGPLAVVHGYREEKEVLAAVRASDYGLAAYIYGPDTDKIMQLSRQLEVSSVKGGGVTITSLDRDAPRSAWGISGLGEEGHFETYRFFQGASVAGMVEQV